MQLLVDFHIRLRIVHTRRFSLQPLPKTGSDFRYRRRELRNLCILDVEF